MPVREVVMYKAEDGGVFPTRLKAEIQNKVLEVHSHMMRSGDAPVCGWLSAEGLTWLAERYDITRKTP